MSALAGKRIVVTRAPHQSSELEHLLHERGAAPLLYPCIDIAPSEDLTPLNTALHAAMDGAFDWLVLTSANTVLALKQRFEAMEVKPAHFTGLQVAAIGAGTARAAEQQLGLRVSVTPEEYTAEALAQALRPADGTRVFLPQSAIAEPTLATTLSDMGAMVTAVEAYRTVVGSGGIDLPALLTTGEMDAITFTSASTVTNLLHRLQTEGGDTTLLARFCLACIGTKTAAAARKHNLPITVMPAEHTLDGLVTALERYYAELTIGESY